MTPLDIDAFIAARPKSLDAEPEWRDGNRAGEKRCSIPVAVAGSQSPISLEMTVRPSNPKYLMALLLVKRKVICRLCMTTGHFDRAAGEEIEGSHYHSWQANRPAGQTLPRRLRHGTPVPEHVTGNDSALAWFLEQNGIDSPPWLPGGWPLREALL